MNDKIQTVKADFNKIKDIRTQVMHCFNALEIKLTKLKHTTNEFIKSNKHIIFIFGLDSFQFQGKLIDYEYNDMRKFYFALNNRMYCEYYKLYKLILQYTEEIIGTNKNIELLKSYNTFPVYKDLEPFKQYNFETIEEIHKTIINLLNDLNDHVIYKETQLQSFQLQQRTGLNINNFVNTFDYDVIVIKQKCLLYLSYLDFFHNIHTKHFKRFSKKMKLMNDYLDEDIKFDESMNTKEYDSINSSASTSSLDSVEALALNHEINSPININSNNKSSIKSAFKSSIKKVMNIIKPNTEHSTPKNISPHLRSENINQMLDTLTNSFDTKDETRIDPINDNIIESILDVNNEDDYKQIAVVTDGLIVNNICNENETINGDKLEQLLGIINSIEPAKDGHSADDNSNISDTINGHNSEASETLNDSIHSTQIDDKSETNEKQEDTTTAIVTPPTAEKAKRKPRSKKENK